MCTNYPFIPAFREDVSITAKFQTNILLLQALSNVSEKIFYGTVISRDICDDVM